MKVTIKQRLVDRMISKGNDFTYTQMITELLKIVYGEDHRYNWRYDRGFYSRNLSLDWNGYMVNGRGSCGVYKNSNGRWSAKYWDSKEELSGSTKKA